MYSTVIGEPFANKDTKLLIHRKVVKRLFAEGREALPHEYSALLAGNGNCISALLPAPPGCGSADSFAWSGPFLLEALRRLHSQGLTWLGVAHTHPRTAAIPSSADAAGWHYPSLGCWIASFASDPPELRLFRMADGRFLSAPFEIVD